MVAAVQYTFTHKQYTKQHKTNNTQNRQTIHKTDKQYIEQFIKQLLEEFAYSCPFGTGRLIMLKGHMMETLCEPVFVNKWMLDSINFIVLFSKFNQTHKYTLILMDPCIVV
jgi:hypothetical protein